MGGCWTYMYGLRRTTSPYVCHPLILASTRVAATQGGKYHDGALPGLGLMALASQGSLLQACDPLLGKQEEGAAGLLALNPQ